MDTWVCTKQVIIFQDKPLNNTNSIVLTHTTSKLILFLLFILQLFPLIIVIVYWWCIKTKLAFRKIQILKNTMVYRFAITITVLESVFIFVKIYVMVVKRCCKEVWVFNQIEIFTARRNTCKIHFWGVAINMMKKVLM